MCKTKRFIRTICSVIICASILTSGFTSYAETPEERVARHQAMPISTDSVAGWPKGPVVSAESAILIDADTGVILYEKNIHEKQYPASITKILTTLIASEECELDDVVTFSHKAVYDTPYDSNHIAIEENEQLTMEDCLKAILIRSANEVSFAVAEHICGSDWENFAPLMNERAKELGCLNSNFVNPNGLPDENHYTTAYDMAMIGRAFFSNEILCNMTTTKLLHILPSANQPDEIMEANKMLIIPGKQYGYDYLVGCKTGYTNDARFTLVACAEKDGMRLISVVMKDESPNHYEDTAALMNYGFDNFDKYIVSEAETKYNIETDGLFYSENDIFGSSSPILFLDKEDYILLPKTAAFSQAVSEIDYTENTDGVAATINYSFNGAFVGSAKVNLVASEGSGYEFETQEVEAELTQTEEVSKEEDRPEAPEFVFINVWKVLQYIVIAALIALVLSGIVKFFRSYQFSTKSTRLKWMWSPKRRRTYDSGRPEISRARIRRAEIAEAKRRQRRNRRRR